MAANEVRALGELAAETVDVTVTTPVQGVHEAVARRVFRAVGPAAEPTRVIHDGIASAVYGALRLAGEAAGAAAGRAAEVVSGSGDMPVLDRSPRGRFAKAAINALIGDQLEERGSELRIEMAVRVRNEDIPLDRQAVAAAFPEPTARIALFVHGLGEDEHAWRLRAAGQGGATYGSRLRSDLGLSPVYLRYNTGLHISENGRRLSELVDALAGGWPAQIEEIVLIGHSMGGLVARSACHHAASASHAWLGRVQDLVFLGSPHCGAPLEKAVNVGSWGLALAAESRPFAQVLNTRSVGIKDLRFGSVSDDDWVGREADDLLQDTCVRQAAPPTLSFHHIAATITELHGHPLGALAGDLLVRHASATGRGIESTRTTTRHFGRRTHFDLLNDPEVYAHMRDCLEATR